MWNDHPYTVFNTVTSDGFEGAVIRWLNPSCVLFQFWVYGSGAVGLRKQFYFFPTWAFFFFFKSWCRCFHQLGKCSRHSLLLLSISHLRCCDSTLLYVAHLDGCQRKCVKDKDRYTLLQIQCNLKLSVLMYTTWFLLISVAAYLGQQSLATINICYHSRGRNHSYLLTLISWYDL